MNAASTVVGEVLQLEGPLTLASMSRLNDSIIENMHTGVLVVNAQRRLRSSNTAAGRLLDGALHQGFPA